MNKTLNLTIELTSDETFDVGILEPESGDFTRIHCHDKGIFAISEDACIMREIRSWVSIMREEEEVEQ